MAMDSQDDTSKDYQERLKIAVAEQEWANIDRLQSTSCIINFIL
jgi:hypothetical protein